MPVALASTRRKYWPALSPTDINSMAVPVSWPEASTVPTESSRKTSASSCRRRNRTSTSLGSLKENLK